MEPLILYTPSNQDYQFNLVKQITFFLERFTANLVNLS